MSREAAIADYHRLLEVDRAAAQEQADWLGDAFRSAGLSYAGTPMRSLLRPQLVERAAWRALCDSATRLLELATRAARHAFGGDVGRLCDYLGTSRAERAWLEHDPGGPDVVLSRLDAFVTSGGPRFIELNNDAPAGFGYGDRMAELFQRLPVFRRFAQGHAVSYQASAPVLLEALRSRAGSPDGTLAIVDWADVPTRADQEILCETFRERGVACRLADPRELELRRGALWLGAERIALVYRRSLLSELVQKSDEVRDLLRAYREGSVSMVNSFRCHLSEDKAFLALLGDENGALLSAEEAAFVEAHVPWTRKLEERFTRKSGERIDLVPWVLSHREDLVLKPAHGYGGRAVLIGDQADASTWEAAVRGGLGAAWIVQERVVIPEEPFPVWEGGELAFAPLKVNTNPFYVAGGAAGAVTRVSRAAVINVSAGGGSVPTFVLD